MREHNIKKERARKIAKVGRYPHTYYTLWNILPETVKRDLASKDIAKMIDMLYRQKVYGENQAWREWTS